MITESGAGNWLSIGPLSKMERQTIASLGRAGPTTQGDNWQLSCRQRLFSGSLLKVVQRAIQKAWKVKKSKKILESREREGVHRVRTLETSRDSNDNDKFVQRSVKLAARMTQ